MKQKLPTILILLVMALVGAMYWVDLSYYTDPATGFITRGAVWTRYAIVALPVVMGLLGLGTVGPRAISVLRVKNRGLGVLFCIAAVMGIAFGGTKLATSLAPLNVYGAILGGLSVWYGVWMFLAALQLFTQNEPSPTKSAIWGILAALPFAMITVYRILVRPSSLYRIGPLVRSFAALFTMLWFGMLLRSLYIALPRRRVRWLYLAGVFAFLFATCLELPLAIHSVMFSGGGAMELFESLSMAATGLVAGWVSVAIAAQGKTEPLPEDEAAPK